MSAPSTAYDDPLHGALLEIVSAMSALNMHPDPIPGATGMLVDTDSWVKHAEAHLQAAIALINRASGAGPTSCSLGDNSPNTTQHQ